MVSCKSVKWMPWFLYKFKKINLMRVPWNRIFVRKARLGKIWVLSSGEHHVYSSLFLCLYGVSLLHPNCGLYCPIVCTSDNGWILRSTGGVTVAQQNRNARRITSFNATFFTKIPHGFLMVWNNDLALRRWRVPTYMAYKCTSNHHSMSV